LFEDFVNSMRVYLFSMSSSLKSKSKKRLVLGGGLRGFYGFLFFALALLS
jgi:hypothetical protein